jgi:hypothetical protein
VQIESTVESKSAMSFAFDLQTANLVSAATKTARSTVSIRGKCLRTS